MKALAFLAVIALGSAPVLAAESAQCDSKPFTLGSPAPAAKKPENPKPDAKAAKPPKPVQSAEAKPKGRLLAPCKDPKKAKPPKG
jgi:hypothetical protein